jgi:hypothetical protein
LVSNVFLLLFSLAGERHCLAAAAAASTAAAVTAVAAAVAGLLGYVLSLLLDPDVSSNI